MKNLYFRIGHRDLIGGGQLALYNLAVALQDRFEVWLSSDFHPGMSSYEFMHEPRRGFRYGRPPHVDVFVASCYTECPLPEGDVNIFYFLYPRYIWDLSGYQHLVAISAYSQRAVQEKFERPCEVVVGGAFSEDYKPAYPKQSLILSCSRFFMEGNPEKLEGHSKNQHVIIRAFKTLPFDRPWNLVLCGSVLTGEDSRYLESCKKLAAGDPRITFLTMTGREEVKRLYSQSKLFVHAMGYGRSDLAETEHYGICVEKALLCGAYVVGHDSGNMPYLCHECFQSEDELAYVLDCVTKLDQPPPTARLRFWKEYQDEVNAIFGRWT